MARTIFTIIYGNPGVGKTPAAATWPRPIVIADADKGTLSIEDRSDLYVFPFYRTGLTRISFDGPPERGEQIEIFHKHFNNLIEQVLEGKVKVGDKEIAPKTLIIDSFTSLCETIKESHMAVSRKARLELAEWGGATVTQAKIMADLIAVAQKVHVVLITHVGEGEVDASSPFKSIIPVGVTKQAGINMIKNADLCMFQEVQKTKEGKVTRWVTQPDGKIHARSRIPGLPGSVTPTKFESIEKYLEALGDE